MIVWQYPKKETWSQSGLPVPNKTRSNSRDWPSSFKSLNPNIHVEIVSVEDIISGNSRNFAQKLMSAADTSYFLVDLDAAGQGYFRDLAAFVEADKSFKSEDFFPGRLDAFQWQGATWALPSQTWMFSLYYDKSMFDAAGVAYPTLDWTSSDFLSASQQLTLREGEEVIQYGFVDNGWYARQVLVHALATQPGTEQTPLLLRPPVRGRMAGQPELVGWRQ